MVAQSIYIYKGASPLAHIIEFGGLSHSLSFLPNSIHSVGKGAFHYVRAQRGEAWNGGE